MRVFGEEPGSALSDGPRPQGGADLGARTAAKPGRRSWIVAVAVAIGVLLGGWGVCARYGSRRKAKGWWPEGNRAESILWSHRISANGEASGQATHLGLFTGTNWNPKPVRQSGHRPGLVGTLYPGRRRRRAVAQGSRSPSLRRPGRKTGSCVD